jgi:hypothetical protein
VLHLQTRRPCDVRERPIPVVARQQERSAAAGRRSSNEQVEIAVVVGVEPGRRTGRRRAGGQSLDLFEAVLRLSEERPAIVVQNEQVSQKVVVVIGSDDLTRCPGAERSPARPVAEAAAIVAVEAKPGRIDVDQIEVAVAV